MNASRTVRSVVGVDDVLPAGELMRRDADELHPGPVGVGDVPRSIGGPDDLRNRLRERVVPRVTLPPLCLQRVLAEERLLALRERHDVLGSMPDPTLIFFALAATPSTTWSKTGRSTKRREPAQQHCP